MKRTLESLWNGDIAPGQTYGVNDPDMEHLVMLMDQNREERNQKLCEEQKLLFDRYIDCSDAFTNLSAVQAFCEGFHLASKLLVEALAET